MAQFLQAVGELARGLPRPSVFPVSCGDDSLPELPPFIAAVDKAMATLEPQDDFAYLDITIPSGFINRVKDGFLSSAADDGPCTVFEAVVAILWQCRTRVVMSDPETPAPLAFTANVREHVGARDGYYGNCVTLQLVVPTSGEVANGDVHDVVKLIKRAKRRIPDQFKKPAAVGAGGDEEEARGGVLQGSVEAAHDAQLFGYNAFFVTSCRNLGHDEVDFGGGTPARVMCDMDLASVPNCAACLPCKGKTDGANVLALCVRKEHAEAFLGELQSSCDRMLRYLER